MKKVQKIVLITGATSGIGKATARKFAKCGYHLIITGRREKRLIELKKRFEGKYGVKIKTLCFDIRDKKACENAHKSLKPEWKKIDILINNAGLASGLDPIHEGNIADWEQMIDTNVKGLLFITKMVIPGMVKRKAGHIINVCSTAGHEVYPRGNVYCASKHAVNALSKAMRIDLHTFGIRVSQVSPAATEDTEFSLVRFHGNKKKAKIYDDYNPLKSKDVAEVIYYITVQPKRVNIQDIILMGTQQANSLLTDKSGRKYD